jgi:pimeloyl-ACP methyl ester carboxylesterase
MPTPSAAADRARPVVLVHGLWHQPGHFEEVARRLRHAVVEVSVPELHRGSLAADTAAVQQLVDTMSRPPIVLGHSYGGSVITGLTAIVHLVYVAAFVPTEHESAAALGGPHLIDTIVHRRADGRTELDPVGAMSTLYGDCTPGDAARAVALLRPQAPGHGRGIPERAAWRTVPSTYVVCTDDHAIDPAIQQRLATRCATILSLATSHSPFCSRPELVVELLTDLVRRQPTII